MRHLRQGPIWLLGLIILSVYIPENAAGVTLRERLNRLPASIGENQYVTRRSGEDWVDIGIREHVAFVHFKRANPAGFRSQQQLLIPGRHNVAGLVSNGLVLNLPELMIYRWADGAPVAWYPVSIGRVTERWHTPVGELSVINRVRNPAWSRPDWAGGGVAPPGPNNPLGDRWIGLNRPGYGIHGTNDPYSIGRKVSHGCIRLFPPHIHELFADTWVGMPVIITYETITVGQEDNVVYLAVFPDIYGRGTNSPGRVRRRLAAFGLDQILTQAEFERKLYQADGVSRPLLGSHKTVTVNGRQANLVVGPTIRSGRSFLPLRNMANVVGAEVGWNPDTKTATISRDGRQESFHAGEAGFIALDTMFIPVRALVEGLGGQVEYSGGNIALNL